MSVHGDSLRQLLRPLRVYELEGSVNGAELDAQGETLDLVEGVLEEIQREMLVCTAEDRGLEAIESLLARRPVTDRLEERRAALAALLIVPPVARYVWQSRNVCVAYVNGQKITDPQQVMMQARRSIEAVADTPGRPNIDSQLNDMFSTLGETAE